MLDNYEIPGGYWPYPVEISEWTGRARLCASVTLDSNSINKELLDRRVEDSGQGQRKKLCLAEALSL